MTQQDGSWERGAYISCFRVDKVTQIHFSILHTKLFGLGHYNSLFIQGKRIFIKDMAQYWIPTHNKPASIAPSLLEYARRVGTFKADTVSGNQNGTNDTVHYPYPKPPDPGNPTIIPEELLSEFHFTFLIRRPHSSIPSYYRCTLEPLRSMTGWTYFDPSEAGYAELRRLFEYVRQKGLVGPRMARSPSPVSSDSSEADDSSGDSGAVENEGVDICVIDADDLLDNPYGVIEAYCKSVGIPFSERMLKWSEEDRHRAKVQFETWKGFHEDAIESSELKPRIRVSHFPKSVVFTKCE